MSVKIWIGSEYDNSHENAMAGEAIARLSDVYAGLDEECNFQVILQGVPERGLTRRR